MIHLLTAAVNQCGQLAMHVSASSVVSFGTALLQFGFVATEECTTSIAVVVAPPVVSATCFAQE